MLDNGKFMRTDNFLQSPTKTESCYHAFRIISIVYSGELWEKELFPKRGNITEKKYMVRDT